jgi:hypothetical protein
MFLTMPPQRALIWALLSSYLLLPVGTRFDIEGLPSLDKTSIPNIVTFVCAVAFIGAKAVKLPARPVPLILAVIFLLSPIVTAYTNTDPINLRFSSIRGLTGKDAVSSVITQLITLAPFVLAHNLLKGPDAHFEVLRGVAVAALLYSVPMLAEVRLSPQLHTWIYGYFPHSFAQQVRDGGFRPVVFLGHGLLVATFTLISIVCLAAMHRIKRTLLGIPIFVLLFYMLIVLLLCKSAGSLILSVLIIPLVLTLSPKRLSIIAAGISLIIVSYPAIRGVDGFPRETIVGYASAISAERSDSLRVRLENEELLLKHANERPAFGWGTWGRNRVFQEDYLSDKDVSITDGTWIIIVGQYGWIGFIACFGLLTYPLIRRLRRGTAVCATMSTAGLAIALTANLIDLIPNSSLTPITWLIAGSLCALPLPSRTSRRRRQKPAPEQHGVGG